MLGAIIGDIVGSIYEFDNIKTKDFNLFTNEMFFTDDTVMTIAIAEAIIEGGKPRYFAEYMKLYGYLYLDIGYGTSFAADIIRESKKLMIAKGHTYYQSRKLDRVPKEAVEELLGITLSEKQD